MPACNKLIFSVALKFNKSCHIYMHGWNNDENILEIPKRYFLILTGLSTKYIKKITSEEPVDMEIFIKKAN